MDLISGMHYIIIPSLCLAEKSKRRVGDDVGEVVGLVVAAVLHPVVVRGVLQDEALRSLETSF